MGDRHVLIASAPPLAALSGLTVGLLSVPLALAARYAACAHAFALHDAATADIGVAVADAVQATSGVAADGPGHSAAAAGSRWFVWAALACGFVSLWRVRQLRHPRCTWRLALPSVLAATAALALLLRPPFGQLSPSASASDGDDEPSGGLPA